MPSAMLLDPWAFKILQPELFFRRVGHSTAGCVSRAPRPEERVWAEIPLQML